MDRSAKPPGVTETRQLPRLLQQRMPTEYADANGHVNVRNYLALHDDAGWEFFARVGADAAYLETHGCGFFDAECHLNYQAEVFVGARVSVHGRVVGRSEKAFHGLWLLVDDEQDRIANTYEVITVFVDLDRRRPAAMPAELAAPIDALAAEHAQLRWEPPLRGCLGLRNG